MLNTPLTQAHQLSYLKTMKGVTLTLIAYDIKKWSPKKQNKNMKVNFNIMIEIEKLEEETLANGYLMKLC